MKQQTKKHTTKTLAILDIDRTLFNSPLFDHSLITLSSQEFGISTEAFRQDKTNTEKSGSFDEVRWHQSKLGRTFPEFYRRFLDYHQDTPFIYEDAHHLLDQLEAWGVPILLMTHGSIVGQQMKITVSKRLLQYDYLVVDAANKGHRLAQAFDEVSARFIIKSDTDVKYHAQ